jgi:hypothetical protein
MKKLKAYRHGENILIQIEKLPEEVQELKTNIFATGSSNNNHSITTGKLFKKEDDLFLEAKNTSLLHPEHSPNIGDAQIEDGFYQIKTQVEYTPEGLKPVID